jgi:hypothetical protein
MNPLGKNGERNSQTELQLMVPGTASSATYVIRDGKTAARDTHAR